MLKKYSIVFGFLSLAAMQQGQEGDTSVKAKAPFWKRCVQKMVVDPFERRYQEDPVLYQARIRVPEFMHNAPMNDQLNYIEHWLDRYADKIRHSKIGIVFYIAQGERKPKALKNAMVVPVDSLAYGERIAVQLTVKIPRSKINDLRSVKIERAKEIDQEIAKRQAAAGLPVRSKL